MMTRDEVEKDRIAHIDAENEAAIRAWRTEREASRSIEYSTNDEYALIDYEFESAHDTVMRCGMNGGEITSEVEAAADKMFDIAVRLGDRVMLSFCFARFDDFVKARRVPPWAMIEHMNDALGRYRAGGSLNSAFGVAKSGKGRPPSWSERLHGRTIADYIAHSATKTGSENRAIANAENFFNRGDLRDVWRRFRRIVKGE